MIQTKVSPYSIRERDKLNTLRFSAAVFCRNEIADKREEKEEDPGLNFACGIFFSYFGKGEGGKGKFMVLSTLEFHHSPPPYFFTVWAKRKTRNLNRSSADSERGRNRRYFFL